jgi:hypothetical protein
MNAFRVVCIVCSASTAICALVAAAYWYLSSRPRPKLNNPPNASISDAPELHILSAQVDVNALQEALSEGSLLNKKGALWSAVAALFGAAVALSGIM